MFSYNRVTNCGKLCKNSVTVSLIDGISIESPNYLPKKNSKNYEEFVLKEVNFITDNTDHEETVYRRISCFYSVYE